MIDYLEQGRRINGAYYASKFRWLSQENHKKDAGKTDMRYSTLA